MQPDTQNFFRPYGNLQCSLQLSALLIPTCTWHYGHPQSITDINNALHISAILNCGGQAFASRILEATFCVLGLGLIYLFNLFKHLVDMQCYTSIGEHSVQSTRITQDHNSLTCVLSILKVRANKIFKCQSCTGTDKITSTKYKA
jgi:hypothetical protein